MIRQCYVAGPYTDNAALGTTRQQNVKRALLAAVQLLDNGWMPIVPHVSMDHETPWQFALLKDKLTIRDMSPKLDVLVLLPGHEHSAGVAVEIETAKEQGITIMSFQEALNARPIM